MKVVIRLPQVPVFEFLFEDVVPLARFGLFQASNLHFKLIDSVVKDRAGLRVYRPRIAANVAAKSTHFGFSSCSGKCFDFCLKMSGIFGLRNRNLNFIPGTRK